jgi:hypothetical protein
MTTPIPATLFAGPAPAQRLERAATALTAHGFTVEILDDAAAALTETGSLVVASGSRSQLPGYAGGAARAIWIVGAQKVVPDLSTALRRVEDHCLPLESARAQVAYGQPSAINCLLILNAEPHPRARHRPAAPRSHRILKPPGVIQPRLIQRGSKMSHHGHRRTPSTLSPISVNSAREKEFRQARSRLAHFEVLVERLRIDVAAFGKPDPGEAGDDNAGRPLSGRPRGSRDAVRRAVV